VVREQRLLFMLQGNKHKQTDFGNFPSHNFQWWSVTERHTL